jgi:hypothetical protein
MHGALWKGNFHVEWALRSEILRRPIALRNDTGSSAVNTMFALRHLLTRNNQ